MNAQFKKGVVEMCVLKIINDNDMYGIEVINSISKELDVNENTIYPLLRRLTTQGYFETYSVEDVSRGAKRKYYRITESGKVQLKKYITEFDAFFKKVLNVLHGGTNES